MPQVIPSKQIDAGVQADAGATTAATTKGAGVVLLLCFVVFDLDVDVEVDLDFELW